MGFCMLTEKSLLRWAELRHEGRCVVTGCDALHEWMLPWWHDSLRRHSQLPLVFVDMGLSRKGRAWCGERGDVVNPAVRADFAELLKPIGLIRSSYAESLWLDLDCEVLKPLEDVFDETTAEIGVARDVPSALDPVQSGVLVVRHGSSTVLEWAELCRNWSRLDRRRILTRNYDQSVLAHLWRLRPGAFTLLRDEWNWVRQKGPSPAAAVFHWWGMMGKEEIRKRITAMPSGYSWRALEEDYFSVFRRGLSRVRRRLLNFKIDLLNMAYNRSLQYSSKIKAIGIIPVRYDSNRFRGKVFADILGKPMIQHVWEKAQKAALLDDLIVAADDERIIDAVRSFGGKAVLTSKKHLSGTDRINEVVQSLKTDIVINIQSDEPMLVPSMIDALITALSKDKNIFMATFRKKINDPAQINDLNTVKVIVDKNDFAIYFSRTPIPFHKNDFASKTYYKHVGIYGYTKKSLSVFSNLPVSLLENSEGLEQLRALENGYKIKVLETQHDTIGVDTPEDLETVRCKLSIEENELNQK